MLVCSVDFVRGGVLLLLFVRAAWTVLLFVVGFLFLMLRGFFVGVI